jgi:hypothetical protein
VFRKMINMSELPLDEDEAESLAKSSSMVMLDRSTEFTPLTCKYVLAIIEEYNRCLMEHQIP